MDVAMLIREARTRHGLDQKALARRAGTSQGQISKIERDIVSPSVSTLERLLGVLGERLELSAVPGSRPKASLRELRSDYERLSVEERVARQAELSEALTTLASTPDGPMNDEQRRHVRLRPLEFLRALREHGVDFLVIGGVAVAAHGYVRATRNVDIIPEPSRANLERLLVALTALDARQDVGDLRPEGLPLQLDLEGLAQGGNWFFVTRYGRLDVMQAVDGARSYETLREAAIVTRGIAYVGLDDLIAMKHAAGRDLDHVDIRALEEARGGAS